MSAVVSNQRSSTRSADGRSTTSPHRSSYTCSALCYLLIRWIWCDSQPRAGLHEGLEAPSDQLIPALRELLNKLSLDGADGAKRELQTRAVLPGAQLEGGDAEGNAQMERPG